VIYPEERVPACIVGAPGLLGIRGHERIEYVSFIGPTLNLCLVFERNHVKLLSGLCGVSVVGDELPLL
jgi:hypothetical protein